MKEALVGSERLSESRPMLCLEEDRVDLWFVRSEECLCDRLLEQYRQLMDEEEQQHWLRYRVEGKRREHLISRALVRTVLSHYLPVHPALWRFTRTPTGKPSIAWASTWQNQQTPRCAFPAPPSMSGETQQNTGCPVLENISPTGPSLSRVCCEELGRIVHQKKAFLEPPGWTPADPPPLELNLSHTDGLILCAVSCRAAVGVDVEETTRSVEFLPLARRFFAPCETAFLEALPPDRLSEAFYRLWTLKEAYLKARGSGLGIPLEGFSFQWPPGEFSQKTSEEKLPSALDAPVQDAGENAPQLVVFFPELGNPADWQFRELRLEERFQVALAVRLPSTTPLRLTLRNTIPLRSHNVVELSSTKRK